MSILCYIPQPSNLHLASYFLCGLLKCIHTYIHKACSYLLISLLCFVHSRILYLVVFHSSQVRACYLKHLEKILLKNYEICCDKACAEWRLSPEDVVRCAVRMEQKALRSCMVVILYQRAMTRLVSIDLPDYAFILQCKVSIDRLIPACFLKI